MGRHQISGGARARTVRSYAGESSEFADWNERLWIWNLTARRTASTQCYSPWAWRLQFPRTRWQQKRSLVFHECKTRSWERQLGNSWSRRLQWNPPDFRQTLKLVEICDFCYC